MSDYQTVGDVLSRLIDEGYLDEYPENPPFDTDSETPIYIKALLGFGGWIASLFFMVFLGWCLFVTLALQSDEAWGMVLTVVGIILIGATTIVNRQKDGVFISQIALAIQIAGHGLFMIGVFYLLDSIFSYEARQLKEVLFSGIVIVLEVIMITLYRDGVFRFLATLVAILSANWILYSLEIPLSLSLLIGLLAFAVFVIWSDILSVEMQIKYRPILQAVGYGLVLGLFGTIAHELSYDPSWYNYAPNLHYPIVTSLILLGITLYLEVRLLADYNVPVSHRLAWILLGMTVIITLPTMTTPGILAALMLILLGYRRRHNMLLGASYLFMAGFISYYYYSLQITLLAKSFILIVTGILFLAAGLSFRRFLPVPDNKEA